MARARNIKPGFFKNEDLADLNTDIRLLFIGLWTLADREGRLDDRPRRIKAELFPFDSFEVDSMLDQLQTSGFIIRYEVGGLRYLQVVNFVKHQDPHYKEKASEIPSPPGGTNIITATQITRGTRARIMERDDYKCRACGSEDYLSIDHVIPVSRGGCGEDSNLQVLCLKCNSSKGNKLDGDVKGSRRSKHDDTSLKTRFNIESTLNQDCFNVPGSVPLIPDSLIPDSLIPDSLIPDSLIPDSRGGIAQVGEDASAGEAPQPPPQKTAAVCIVLKSEGIGIVNPGHPDLSALLQEGVEVGQFAAVAKDCVARGKPNFAYVLATVKGQLADAKQQAASASMPRIRPNQPQSFARQDAIDGMLRWEQMTGSVHPDWHTVGGRPNLHTPNQAPVIDMGAAIEVQGSKMRIPA